MISGLAILVSCEVFSAFTDISTVSHLSKMRRTYLCIVLIIGTLLSLQIAKGDNVNTLPTDEPTGCQPFTCDLTTCENGFKRDAADCPICECNANGELSSPQMCPSPMCRTFCEQGFQRDANGCLTCDCIDEDIWENREFDSNHAHHLQVIDVSDSFINLTWMPPNVTADKLNNHMVYYFNLTTGPHGDQPECPNGVENPKTKLILPTQTVTVVKGLKSGTTYGFCVQTNYSNGQVTTSHRISYTTLGVGPGNPCKCRRTKFINYQQPCDLVTGECRCKTKYQTGKYCDACVEGYYMHKSLFCQKCNCPGIHSTGNCQPINHGDGAQIFKCECHKNFAGIDCNICKAGYYHGDVNADCVECQCNDNTRPGASNICDHITGECTECGYNTTGPHCETCLAGYVGSALNRTCALPVTTVSLPTRFVHPASSLHEIGIIVTVCVSVALFFVFLAVLIIYCARPARGKPFQFWSVQMRGGREDINFSPMSKNSDLCLLSDDGVQYFERDESPGGGRLEFLGGSQIFRAPRA